MRFKGEENYESNRHRTTGGRSGQNRHSKGDQKNPTHPRGRPVADIIDTVGEILLRDGRFGQTAGMGVVHSDGCEGRNRGYLERTIFTLTTC